MLKMGTSAIDTHAELHRVEDPYVYFTADGVISPENLKLLNAVIPDRTLFRREIKEGSHHRKEYNMWRCEPAVDSQRTAVADQLPPTWSDLAEDALSTEFRSWLTRGTGVDVRSVPVTVGLYMFGDGDYTTVDTGKLEKALSFGLYLNEHWARRTRNAITAAANMVGRFRSSPTRHRTRPQAGTSFPSGVAASP